MAVTVYLTPTLGILKAVRTAWACRTAVYPVICHGPEPCIDKIYCVGVVFVYCVVRSKIFTVALDATGAVVVRVRVVCYSPKLLCHARCEM